MMEDAAQQSSAQRTRSDAPSFALGASSGGPDHARLSEHDDRLNAHASSSAAWERQGDQWLQIAGSDGEPPSWEASEGEVYDEGADELFEDVHAWLDWRVPHGAPLSDADEARDEDYEPQADAMDEEEDDRDEEEHADDRQDEGEDETAMAIDGSSSSSSGMSLDARRAEAQRALARPVETSLLTAPDRSKNTRVMTSDAKFRKGGKLQTRSTTAGPVTITLQEVALYVGTGIEKRERPIAVSGLVDPTVTTGRGGAPDPISGIQVYSGKGARPSASAAVERNNGMPDVERGHVMALELGGPDIPENIVPQWGKFQGSGVWRRMEVGVLAKARALKRGQSLHYSVDIFYKSSGDLTPTLKTFGFPTGFRTTTQVLMANGSEKPIVEFEQGQAQDQTDTMIADRQLSLADGDAWDHELDFKKARAKANATGRAKRARSKKRAGVRKPRKRGPSPAKRRK